MPTNVQPLLITPATAAECHSRTIRVATEEDVRFCEALQLMHSDSLGFLPTDTHRRYCDARQVLIVEENAWPAGFVNFIPAKTGVLRIPQVAIHIDLLNTRLGSLLVGQLRLAAQAGGCTMIRLTTRSDLPANAVWPKLGFIPTGYQTPINTRRRPLIEWTLPLYRPEDLAAALRHHYTPANYAPPATTPTPALEAITCTP